MSPTVTSLGSQEAPKIFTQCGYDGERKGNNPADSIDEGNILVYQIRNNPAEAHRNGC